MAVVDFFWCGWMDGWWRGVGGREITWYRVLGWLLVLVLRVGIVRIIILMYFYYQSA